MPNRAVAITGLLSAQRDQIVRARIEFVGAKNLPRDLLRFDNFAVDPPPPAKLAYLQQPGVGTAGAPLAPFVVAVEDIAGHIVATDASTVTLTLSHGTFANGTIVTVNFNAQPYTMPDGTALAPGAFRVGASTAK